MSRVDILPFLLGFMEKVSTIQEDLVQYPLKQPEITVKKKHSDQIPTQEEDKLGSKPCKEAMAGNSVPSVNQMPARSSFSFDKLPQRASSGNKPLRK